MIAVDYCDGDLLAVHAIELNPAYVDVAVLRWQAFTGQEATLAEDGRTFAELADERSA